jgi:hypothetical protein
MVEPTISVRVFGPEALGLKQLLLALTLERTHQVSIRCVQTLVLAGIFIRYAISTAGSTTPAFSMHRPYSFVRGAFSAPYANEFIKANNKVKPIFVTWIPLGKEQLRSTERPVLADSGRIVAPAYDP